MAAQVLDFIGRFRPHFVIAHLFGRAPSVSIKELKGKGYPLSKVISLVWGSSEADIEAAGGYAAAEGYHTMQFAGVGSDFQVIKDIDAMYRAQGKPAPKEQATSVYYNRGLMTAGRLLRRRRDTFEVSFGSSCPLATTAGLGNRADQVAECEGEKGHLRTNRDTDDLRACAL
jgi:branched-chain amino acid transport system substrate-binding protein